MNQFGLFKLFSAAGGAAGYIVSRKAATHITSSEEIFFRPTDQALFDPYGAISRIIVTLQLIPALCIQEDRLTSSAERLVSSDLESARLNRDKIDKSNFWRRSVFNLQDFVTRDIALPARNAWLKVRYDIAKRDIPFLDT
jgi:GR25 family glycosyltransferase involved in LPS biosynthesis